MQTFKRTIISLVSLSLLLVRTSAEPAVVAPRINDRLGSDAGVTAITGSQASDEAAAQVADRVGFRSDFSYDEQILARDWQVASVRSVNFLGLSKLVAIRNV